MTRLGIKIGVLLISIVLTSLPVSQTLAIAEAPAGQPEEVSAEPAPEPSTQASADSGVAGGGVAGGGVARSVDRVVLRNSLIGLAVLGLLAFSIVNEAD
jgi:hypothetical protein